MPIRAIFFDLDDTLSDEAGSVAEAVEATSRLIVDQFNLPDWRPLADLYNAIGESLWATFDSWGPGLGTFGVRRHIWKATLAAANLACPDDLLDTFARHYVDLRRSNHRWLPGARETLLALRERYLIGLITNGATQIQREKICTLGIETLCRTTLVAEECGCSKPETAIFHRALDLLGVHPDESLMVGDRPETDMLGAHRVGMRGVWIAPPDKPWPLPNATFWRRIPTVSSLPSLLRDLL